MLLLDHPTAYPPSLPPCRLSLLLWVALEKYRRRLVDSKNKHVSHLQKPNSKVLADSRFGESHLLLHPSMVRDHRGRINSLCLTRALISDKGSTLMTEGPLPCHSSRNFVHQSFSRNRVKSTGYRLDCRDYENQLVAFPSLFCSQAKSILKK